MRSEAQQALRAVPLAFGALALAVGACGPGSGGGADAGSSSGTAQPAAETSGSQAPAPFEAPPTLQASDLIPAALLKR